MHAPGYINKTTEMGASASIVRTFLRKKTYCPFRILIISYSVKSVFLSKHQTPEWVFKRVKDTDF